MSSAVSISGIPDSILSNADMIITSQISNGVSPSRKNRAIAVLTNAIARRKKHIINRGICQGKVSDVNDGNTYNGVSPLIERIPIFHVRMIFI